MGSHYINHHKGRYINKKIKGYTIIESLIVVSLMLIVFTFAIPHFSKTLMTEERQLSLQNLINAIEFAKTAAIQHQTVITVCMSLDQQSCVAGKGNYFIVFKNEDKSAQPKSDAILRVGNFISYGTIEFKCFGNTRAALDIEPNGFTYNNGHFCYCPKNADSKDADALIINNASRVYRPKNRNFLGVLMIDKNASLSCY